MKLNHLLAGLACMASPVSSQLLEQNRLQLDNGGDVVSFLSDPFTGSDPANGDYTGDFYYKIWPGEANQRCSGTWTWTGLEYPLFDDDWSNGAQVYTVVLSPAADPDSNDTLTPDLGTSPSEVILVGGPIAWDDLAGGPFNPVLDCPAPGFFAGFDIRETYIDTAGTGLLDPAFTLATGDFAISSFFPGGQSTTVPALNSCGGSGDASYSWLRSADTFDPLDGENQPDWTLLPGASAYGGFQLGSPFGGALMEETLDGGAELAVLMDEPTLNMKVDVGLDAVPFPEIGLASLNPQVGLDGSGTPTGTSAEIGVMIFSESSKPSTNANGVGSGGVPFVGFAMMNIGPTLFDLNACVTIPGVVEDLGLNPGDPLLALTLAPMGINPFMDGTSGGTAGGNTTADWDGDGTLDDGVSDSLFFGIAPSAGLCGIGLVYQGYVANAVTSDTAGTNGVRVVLSKTP